MLEEPSENAEAEEAEKCLASEDNLESGRGVVLKLVRVNGAANLFMGKGKGKNERPQLREREGRFYLCT